MGSGNLFFDEAPVHPVTIPRPFYLGTIPVTQRQWVSVCGDNPSAFPNDDHSVDSVSWLDAVRFCGILSASLQRTVRLPTEAEWEFACRAGTPGEYFFSAEGPFPDGSAIPVHVRRALREFAWFEDNSQERTQPVGGRRPNPFGLHDMIGNVWDGALTTGTPTTVERRQTAARGWSATGTSPSAV